MTITVKQNKVAYPGKESWARNLYHGALKVRDSSIADRLQVSTPTVGVRTGGELETVLEFPMKVTNVDNEEPRVNQTVVLEIKYKEISWKRYCKLQ